MHFWIYGISAAAAFLFEIDIAIAIGCIWMHMHANAFRKYTWMQMHDAVFFSLPPTRTRGIHLRFIYTYTLSVSCK